MNFRIGQGYDVHRLVEGRKLILGGVEIPHATGLLGHSDADALLHAITDALLGAVALGDIGRHFPDTDPRYKGADSRVLLRGAVALLRERGWAPVNVDATLIAQQPKLAPHAAAMVANVAADLGIGLDCVNIKGKTNEKLGYLGAKKPSKPRPSCLSRKSAKYCPVAGGHARRFFAFPPPEMLRDVLLAFAGPRRGEITPSASPSRNGRRLCRFCQCVGHFWRHLDAGRASPGVLKWTFPCNTPNKQFKHP